MPRSQSALFGAERCDRYRVWTRLANLTALTLALAVFAGCGTLHQMKAASLNWIGHGHAQVAQVCSEPLEPVCHGYEQTMWRPMNDCEPITALEVTEEMPLEAEAMQPEAMQPEAMQAEEPLPVEAVLESETSGLATPLPSSVPAQPVLPQLPEQTPVMPAVDSPAPAAAAPAPMTPAPVTPAPMTPQPVIPNSVVVPPPVVAPPVEIPPASTPPTQNPTPEIPAVPETPAVPPAVPNENGSYFRPLVPNPVYQARASERRSSADERSNYFRARNQNYKIQPSTISSATAAFALFNEISRAIPLAEPDEENALDVPTPAEHDPIPMAKFISVE